MKSIYIPFVFLCAISLSAQEQYLEKLPDNPDPGKCYAKCIVPDRYEIETDSVLKVPAHGKLRVVPAQYKTVNDEVVIKPASKKYHIFRPLLKQWLIPFGLKNHTTNNIP